MPFLSNNLWFLKKLDVGLMDYSPLDHCRYCSCSFTCLPPLLVDEFTKNKHCICQSFHQSLYYHHSAKCLTHSRCLVNIILMNESINSWNESSSDTVVRFSSSFLFMLKPQMSCIMNVMAEDGGKVYHRGRSGVQCSETVQCPILRSTCRCFVVVVVVVQSLRHVQLFVTSWNFACQASLSFTTSWSLRELMSIELVMPSNHLVLCCPLLLLLSIFPVIRVFSSELTLHFRWPKYWSFSFSISPSYEYSGLISFKSDCLIFLQSRGLSRVFPGTAVRKHQFSSIQPALWSNSYICT